MTQPAKSQEPSMEEILASIRRIIADDDSTKPAPESPKAAAAPPRPAAPAPRPPAAPARPAVPEPSPLEAVTQALAAMVPATPMNNGSGVDEQSADILDLTESMAAPAPPAPSPALHVAPSFRTINGESDVVGFDDSEDNAPPALVDPS
jgi:uncharacterized protein